MTTNSDRPPVLRDRAREQKIAERMGRWKYSEACDRADVQYLLLVLEDADRRLLELEPVVHPSAVVDRPGCLVAAPCAIEGCRYAELEARLEDADRQIAALREAPSAICPDCQTRQGLFPDVWSPDRRICQRCIDQSCAAIPDAAGERPDHP